MFSNPLLDHILANQLSEATDLFNNLMQSRIDAIVETKRPGASAKMFGESDEGQAAAIDRAKATWSATAEDHEDYARHQTYLKALGA